MKKENKILLLISAISISLLFSCYQPDTAFPIKEQVWVPQYGAFEDMEKIFSTGPREIETAGKIYIYNNFLFQVDPGKGIHVYQFIDKTPEAYSFIQVLGAQEISIRNNILYTNNYTDLVGIDISDPFNIQIKSRTKDVFENGTGYLPPSNGYYQCVDPDKGIVIGWELKENVAADCLF